MATTKTANDVDKLHPPHDSPVCPLPLPRVDIGLPVRPLATCQAPVAFVVKGFLSEEECKTWILHSEARGYAPALVNVGAGRQVLDTDTRNSQRNIFDSSELARDLFGRLRPLLPDNISYRRCTGINERLRFLRYDPGEYFAPHFDGRYCRPDGSESSLLTLMIYLNSGNGEDFSGGSTRFLSGSNSGEDLDVVPERGDALVFSHNLLHEGAAVTQGRKYCVRTDVMFECAW